MGKCLSQFVSKRSLGMKAPTFLFTKKRKSPILFAGLELEKMGLM